MLELIQGLLGLLLLTGFAWLISEDRGQVNWRVPVAGLAVQFVIAVALLRIPVFQTIFLGFNDVVLALQAATEAGASFVFGYLGGGPAPFEINNPGNNFILAFRALPLILIVSALSALLFYWKILPLIVGAFAWLLQTTMGIGGALGLGAAANVFVGMIEAPLLIRPYLRQMSRGEIFALMVCGMATIAGTMMALYASILASAIPNAAGHILTASLISAPAALMIAHLMVPTDSARTGSVGILPSEAHSSMDAITRGTMDGLKLLAGVVAMLVVLVALVSLVNQLLALLPAVADSPISLERMLGWIMSPVAWLMGVPWQEAGIAGALLGTKTILNEFIAYLHLTGDMAAGLSDRTRLIMTYALCGFANLGSLGIMLGGLCAMAPERRKDFVSLGGKSVIAGTLATCLTGAMAGLILG